MLRENEGVREKRISFFRRAFEAVVVSNTEVCNVMCQLVSMFLQTDSECVCDSELMGSLLVKTTLNLCSCFVPYLGARSNYAAFLDQLFEINTKKLVNEDLEEVVKNRILTINTYIFNFNVSKKNITPIRINVKENVSSVIDQFLLSTGLITTEMYQSLVSKMSSCKDEMGCVEIMRDFVNEMQNSGEGSGTKREM